MDKFEAQARMREMIRLHNAGVAIMKQNIRRRMPNASEEEIEEEFRRWYHRLDDPIPGDVAGPVRVRKWWG